MSLPTVILVDQQGKVASLNARGPELGKLLAKLLGPPEKEGGATSAKKPDKPADLEKNIDVWRDAAASMCTVDAQADYKVLSGAPVQAVACPEPGVHVSLLQVDDVAQEERPPE